MILATFIFADGSERSSDVDERPPSELVMDEVPAGGHQAICAWLGADPEVTGAIRRTFALLEGGPPYRYREVVGVAAPGAEATS